MAWACLVLAVLAGCLLVAHRVWVSPNGRVIAFFRSTPADSKGNFTRKLYTVDVTGYNEREMITPVDGADPAWSP